MHHGARVPSFLLVAVYSLLNESRKEALKHLSYAFTEISHNRFKTSGIQPGFSCSARTSSLLLESLSGLKDVQGSKIYVATMGVPKFYRWISERYPCLSEIVKEHQVGTEKLCWLS